jgi:hypothetical protein
MDKWRRDLYNQELKGEDKVWRKFWVKENNCMVKNFFFGGGGLNKDKKIHMEGNKKVSGS